MLARAAVLLAVAIPLAWFFGRAICTDEMFGYRDAAHYYYPYYWYVHEHWAHGIVPLWNPLENLGQPLAADPTAAAFYPAKLLFFLPLPYDWLYKVYIVGHVALCAAAAYWLARQWQASRPAAALAAVTYAFGGPVVFQYANVVFLVGAAWLPLALWGAHRIVVKRDWWGVLAFALAAAMMILGGDPEAAYLAALATLLLAFLEWRRQAVSTDGQASGLPYGMIAAAFALAFALSAIQLIPSIVWGQKTERALYDSPRSVWEIPSYLARPNEPEDPPLPGEVADPAAESITWYRDLIGQPQENTHHADVYRFSVGPWRLVELLWPNFYGREFPENRRWGSILPNEESPWTPSLYIGLIPLLLLLTQLTFLSGPIRSRWLTWTLVILTLGSFGCFGIVWAIREVIYLCSGHAVEMPLGEAVGGVYWFFTVLLPGFVQFRYPAKLLVLATLCAAMLAAKGLDRMLSGRSERLLMSFAIISGLLTIHVLLTTLLCPYFPPDASHDIEPNFVFGPLDLPGARDDLLRSLAQGVIGSLFLAGCCWLLRFQPSQGDSATCRIRDVIGLLILLFVGSDLCWAHAWSALTVSSKVSGYVRGMQMPRGLPETARQAFDPDKRDHIQQERFFLNSSPGRLTEIVMEDLLVRMPKYNLLTGDRAQTSRGSANYAEFRHHLSVLERAEWTRLLYVGEGFKETFPRRMCLTSIAATAEPRFAAEIQTRSPTSMRRRGSRWIMSTCREKSPWDSGHQAFDVLVESASHPNELTTDSKRLEGIRASANAGRPSYDAMLPAPTWLVFPEQYDPDFVCEVTDLATGGKSQTPIYRAQRVLRGIHLPAGRFEVRFLYRPWSFYLGLAVSLVTWPLAVWLVWRQWRM